MKLFFSEIKATNCRLQLFNCEIWFVDKKTAFMNVFVFFGCINQYFLLLIHWLVFNLHNYCLFGDRKKLHYCMSILFVELPSSHWLFLFICNPTLRKPGTGTAATWRVWCSAVWSARATRCLWVSVSITKPSAARSPRQSSRQESFALRVSEDKNRWTYSNQQTNCSFILSEDKCHSKTF